MFIPGYTVERFDPLRLVLVYNLELIHYVCYFGNIIQEIFWIFISIRYNRSLEQELVIY
jgi:hypothetical protein